MIFNFKFWWARMVIVDLTHPSKLRRDLGKLEMDWFWSELNMNVMGPRGPNFYFVKRTTKPN